MVVSKNCVFGLLVIGLSFNTNSIAVVLCSTTSEISVATLYWSCTVHCWYRVSHIGGRAH